MDETKKHIDELVATRTQKQAELREIGRKIKSSATPAVVAFVDLAESTQMKRDREPEEWLGIVFEFIKRVDQLGRAAKGKVVKRIGDALMVTFNDVHASEHFVSSLITDTALQIYRYKIAVDYGNAYHFRFEEPLPDDPYGPMVDRCARIAEITRAGTALCSDEYRRQLGGSCAYVSVGKFSLRGFPDPEELFLRSLVEVDSAAYLKPLISAVNEQDPHVQGYRFVGRKLTTEFVRDFGQDDVRPFLARELLSIPKLPHSPKEFSDVVGEAGNIEEKEREFIGYFVEWEGTFEGFTSDRNRIVLTLEVATPSVSDHYFHILLVLPHSNLEIVKALRKGQLLRARGIIQDITFHMIRLNYVDLETVDEGGVACE